MEPTLKETDESNNYDSSDLSGTGKVYFWLIICSIMMFTLPFAAFFLVKHWLDEYYHIDGFENNCWSTLAAVVVVNLIIGFYAYIAYLEDKNDHPKNSNKKAQ